MLHRIYMCTNTFLTKKFTRQVFNSFICNYILFYKYDIIHIISYFSPVRESDHGTFWEQITPSREEMEQLWWWELLRRYAIACWSTLDLVLYFEHEISRQRFVHVERMSRYFDRMKINFNLIRYTLHTIIIYKNLVVYENFIRVWFNKLI